MITYEPIEQIEYYNTEAFGEEIYMDKGETKEFIFPEYISETYPAGSYTIVASLIDLNTEDEELIMTVS